MAHSTSHGRERFRYYVCRSFHNRGRAVCANNVPLAMTLADEAVLAKLREFLLPDLVEGALTDAIATLRPQAETIDARRGELEKQIRMVDDETARLTAAIAAGGELGSLVTALRDRDGKRTALRQEIDTLAVRAQVSTMDVRQLEKKVRARVKEWRALLGRQTLIARQIVTRLLDGRRLVFTPRPDRSWTFTGHATFGKLLQGIVPPLLWRPQRDSDGSGQSNITAFLLRSGALRSSRPWSSRQGSSGATA